MKSYIFPPMFIEALLNFLGFTTPTPTHTPDRPPILLLVVGALSTPECTECTCRCSKSDSQSRRGLCGYQSPLRNHSVRNIQQGINMNKMCYLIQV